VEERELARTGFLGHVDGVVDGAVAPRALDLVLLGGVLGVVDELVARGIPPTGTSNIGGSIVTAGGLVFIGATNDSRFRAFDKDTGKEVWMTKLPASAHATPMTFVGRKTGKQYVVIAAGGGNKYNKVFSDSLVAFSLP